jgi:hypothetical protein
MNTSDCAGNISQTDRTTKLKKRERKNTSQYLVAVW